MNNGLLFPHGDLVEPGWIFGCAVLRQAQDEAVAVGGEAVAVGGEAVTVGGEAVAIRGKAVAVRGEAIGQFWASVA